MSTRSRTFALIGCVAAVLVGITRGIAADQTQTAKPPQHSDAFETCQSAASTTQAIVECYGAETKLWDERLNTAYRALMKAYTDADKEFPLPDGGNRVALLRTAQRAWLGFRDADCTLQRSIIGGSLSRIAGAACDLDHLLARTAALNGLLLYDEQIEFGAAAGGDTSPGAPRTLYSKVTAGGSSGNDSRNRSTPTASRGRARPSGPIGSPAPRARQHHVENQP